MGSSEDNTLESPIKDPIQIVLELIELTLKNQLSKMIKKTLILKTIIKDHTVMMTVKRWIIKKTGYNAEKVVPKDIVEW